MPDTTVRLEQLLPLIRERLAAGELVQFTPRGTSMRPMLEGGRDQVILSPLPPRLKKYDIPLYRRADGHFVLHRIVKAGQTCTCIGDNQFVLEKNIPCERMIAVVTGFVRKGKYYSVDSLGYRVYCRFWHWTRPFRHFGMRCRDIPAAIVRRVKKIFS